MDKDEMIGIPDADESTVMPPAPGAQDSNVTPPASNDEVDGILLDNEDAANSGGADDGGSAQDDSAVTTGTDRKPPQGDEKTSTDEKVAGQLQPEAPAPQPVADPGDFQPKDYSFDVELADGSKIHIAKPEDIENLPADADFGSPKNLMQAQANFSRMVNGIDADKREYDASKKAYDDQQASAVEVEQRVTAMLNEMNYLETKGKLPAVADEFKEADWSDPKVAEQPGVKERLALLEYRAKENAERTKLGLSPMSVLEAHMQMQQDAAEAKAADVKQKQGEQRKAKGAMVTGPSVLPTNNMPDDMIIGEGGSIRDIGN